MATFYTLPSQEDDGKTLKITFDMEVRRRFLPAEWSQQSGVQLTWPHAGTDWAYMLEEVQACFTEIAREISKRERLLIVAPDTDDVYRQLDGKATMENITFFTCDTNDTWARDHAFVTLMGEDTPLLLDFRFNGWGEKFEASLDNAINRKLYQSGLLKGQYADCQNFVLEGGSIESDGKGTLLTTSACLLSKHRNDSLNKADIENRLKSYLYAEQVLWLDYGYLAGDDTDGHIDTLARLCPNDTIVYVKCNDVEDEHCEALKKMENQLQTFRTLSHQPYRLLPLPMADAVVVEGERLPATYANFLVMNEAVLYPVYAQPKHDAEAATVLQEAFPKHEIVGIDCRALIKQHGSLHCVTMQYPAGVL